MKRSLLFASSIIFSAFWVGCAFASPLAQHTELTPVTQVNAEQQIAQWFKLQTPYPDTIQVNWISEPEAGILLSEVNRHIDIGYFWKILINGQNAHGDDVGYQHQTFVFYDGKLNHVEFHKPVYANNHWKEIKPIWIA